MALQRTFRLRKSSDFQRVRQQGSSTASRLLILAWAPNDRAQVRIGFVISKRISKCAVSRNYIKRLLGESIRPVLVNIPVGWDIVFIARNRIIGIDLPTITQDMAVLLRRARLLEASVSQKQAETKH